MRSVRQQKDSMRILRVVIVLLGLCGCEGTSPPGPPVGLAAVSSDTIIVNSRRPTLLPVHAVDAEGRTVAQAPIRFERVGGASLPLTRTGAVTCTSSSDLHVRAILDTLTTVVVVRCRLVEHVRIPGPMQFVLDDSAFSQPRVIPVGAYSADGRPVAPFTLTLSVGSDVATLHGATLYPRTQGITSADARVGDRVAGTGVHIYQRVEGFDALDTMLRVAPHGRLFAVPLLLEAGSLYRQRLPPGQWMLTIMPRNEHDPTPIRFQVDSAACVRNLLNDPGRLGCEAGSRASVVVFRTPDPGAPALAEGYLLVRWLFNPNPRRFLPRVPATPQSVACAKRVLEARGYDVPPSPDDRGLLRAQRREGRLGTKARRELIEIRFVPDTAGATLRGTAWAEDSYPTIQGRSRARGAIEVEPLEETLSDGRAALQQCGRR
jgi:hypothetical protein